MAPEPSLRLDLLRRERVHLRLTSVRRERNAVQVQRWLGHHSAAFTLTTYVHLLDEDLGEPLELPARGVSGVLAGHTPTDAIAGIEEEAIAA